LRIGNGFLKFSLRRNLRITALRGGLTKNIIATVVAVAIAFINGLSTVILGTVPF
jgi:hypothetical protein